MLNRYLKIDLALFLALFCLFYATQNIFNLQSAHWFVSSMMSMEGHEAYANHFGPAVTSPALTWAATWIIIALEYLAGLLALKGSWDLWAARKASSADFHAAKRCVFNAVGVGLFIWFGIFHAIGGAYFQMWQTEAGGGAFNNSAQFVIMLGILALYFNMADAELS